MNLNILNMLFWIMLIEKYLSILFKINIIFFKFKNPSGLTTFFLIINFNNYLNLCKLPGYL